jgi:malonate transporter
MQALLDVIAPVFVLIGVGFSAVRIGWLGDAAVDSLMRFAQNFAITCLLFRAISTLDLGAAFDPGMLTAFYGGALGGFAAAYLGARHIFGRDPEESVVIGFCGLFSNSVTLGLSIVERAYGADTLRAAFAIASLHAPFCYAVGISAMEITRSRGRGFAAGARRILAAMFGNVLVIAIGAGFAANLLELGLPRPVAGAVDALADAALPVALFGLGGVLARYSPAADLRVILWACGASLLVHPAIAWATGRAIALDQNALRAAVMIGAMSPGVNCYVFATLYGVGQRVAAATVLTGTALAVLTAWLWLSLLD